MKISILGTGTVGQVIAAKLLKLGHHVSLITRDKESTKERTKIDPQSGFSFKEWYENYQDIALLNYEETLADTDLFINATSGFGSIDALTSVGADKLADHILLDIANPLDFSKGMPPSLFICNTDSLGETIQRTFPRLNVVKSLNTMNCSLMMNPRSLKKKHNVFLSGNNPAAKLVIRNLLEEIGWWEDSIIDLGDIKTARAAEQLLPIWINLWGVLGTAEFNFRIIHS